MPKHKNNHHKHHGEIVHGHGGHRHHRRNVRCNNIEVEVGFPMYYLIIENGEVHHTVEVVKDHIIVDYDAAGNVIGFEIE